MWTYNYSDELYHYGIKGMKWGVRRFQKKDGSLTSAGKKRYSEDFERAKSNLSAAKENRRTAYTEYNKAYYKYQLVPTKTNYAKTVDCLNKARSADKTEAKAKLDYKVAKYESNGGFNSSIKKSKHQQVLEEKYRNQGYSDKQATIMARDRIRTERVVVGAAALTVTACAAYAANKYVKNRTDGIIKSGDILQRIEMQNTDGKLHDMFYASSGSHDNKRYEGILGMTRQKQTGKAYIMKLEAQNDIRVASKEKAAKVFGELYKNDADFRESVKNNVSQHFGGSNKIKDINNMSDRNIRKMYDNFNSGLIHIRDQGSGADKKFYNKLKEAGYGAIQDVNDMKYSGYNAKNPLIVFDNAKQNIMTKTFEELTDKKAVNKKGAIELGKSTLEGMGKDLLSSPYTAVAAAGTAGTMYVSDYAGATKKTSKKTTN